MRFSIIIPVYNAEKFLEKCLDSVLCQKYDDYEILLINDGSQDSSGDICLKYLKQYGNIQYMFQENAGPSAARNIGIQQSTGDYLIFLDADDEIENGSLVLLDEIVVQNPVDVIISGEKSRRREGQNPVVEKFSLERESFNKGKKEALKELSEKRFSLLTHKVVLRREILIKNNLLFDTTYRVGEDILLVVQALCKCEFFYLNTTPYYIYNVNDTSIMRTINFEKIWCTTDICSYLYGVAQSSSECEKTLIYTTISMLMIGFTQYYKDFSSQQRTKTRTWMRANRKMLADIASTHPSTKLAGKLLGSGNAFLLAGLVVGLKK